jgi:hypothetical protein
VKSGFVRARADFLGEMANRIERDEPGEGLFALLL